jgi:uncharacterized protein YjeT (DUF2065 family)
VWPRVKAGVSTRGGGSGIELLILPLLWKEVASPFFGIGCIAAAGAHCAALRTAGGGSVIVAIISLYLIKA